jgi:hypothetical protein
MVLPATEVDVAAKRVRNSRIRKISRYVVTG